MSNPDKQRVHVSFRYTEPEYLAAVRFYFRNSKELVVRFVVSCLAFSLCLLLVSVLLEFAFPLWASLALILLVCFAWIHAWVVDVPRRYFRDDPKFRDEYNLTFSDDGIEFQTLNVKASFLWNFYTGVMENDSFYLLIYGKVINSLSIIPKRAFLDAEQETSFRAMLRRHVDHRLKLADAEREKEYVPKSFMPPDWR